MEPKNKTLYYELRSLSSIALTNNCWLFNGSKNKNGGYGQKQFQGKLYAVHRLSAYLFLDFDLDSKENINHKIICPNKHCWNPDHIYVGTQQNNIDDLKIQNRYHNFGMISLAKTHCPQGHEYTKENTYHRNYRRHCRTCHREKETVRRNKLRETRV